MTIPQLALANAAHAALEMVRAVGDSLRTCVTKSMIPTAPLIFLVCLWAAGPRACPAGAVDEERLAVPKPAGLGTRAEGLFSER